jgi:hypothetical protein
LSKASSPPMAELFGESSRIFVPIYHLISSYA